MKHIYTLLLLLAATTAFAATPFTHQKARAPRAVKAHAPQFDQPAGTLRANLWRDAREYSNEGWQVTRTDETGLVADIVDAADAVYVKTLVWGYNTEAWAKGVKTEGDTVVFTFPQQIEYEDYGDDDIVETYLQRGYYDAETKTFLVSDTLTVKFTYRDGTLTMAEPAFIGTFDATGEWNGYGTERLTIKPAPYTLKVPAAETPSTSCALTYGEGGDIEGAAFVNMAVEGQTLYLQGLNTAAPELWAAATIEGDSVTFANKLYLGPDRYNRRHTFLLTCYEGEAWDDEYEEYVPVLMPKPQLRLAYDAQAQTLSGTDYLVVNMNDRYVNFTDLYACPAVAPWQECAATPQDPVITSYSNDYDQVIRFQVPLFDTEGRLMNPDKVFFNIIFDDDPYTFTADDGYYWLDGELTDVPLMTDNYDIYASGQDHSVYLYNSLYERIGVQVIYRGAGEEHRSNIVYYADPATALRALTSAAGTVRYTDLAGRRATAHSRGLLIRQQTLTDGSVRTDKVVR